jgi:hypothetical protein
VAAIDKPYSLPTVASDIIGDIAFRGADEIKTYILALNCVPGQLCLHGTGDEDSVIIFRKLVGLQAVVGRPVQLYAEQAANYDVFPNLVLARRLNDNAIHNTLQLIAGKIIVLAVLQEYTLRAIEYVISNEIVLHT